MASMTLASSTPELFGTQVAVLAFVVAACGFLVSLVALGWQISKHILDGGRVRVYLNPAIWEPGGRMVVNRNGRWPLEQKLIDRMLPENFEVAQLVVENPGRTALTIYNPGLAVRGAKFRKYTFVPRFFKLTTFGSENTNSDSTVRIDPYDRVIFLMDYWPMVSKLLDEAKGGRICLRGNVSVAGRKSSRRSSRHLAWSIPRGSWTSLAGLTEISPRTVMWRELYRLSLRTSEDEEGSGRRSIDGGVLYQAMRAFEQRPALDDFETELRRAAGKIDGMSAACSYHAYMMYEALDAYQGNLGPWGTKSNINPPSSGQNASPQV